jgi:DNA modification methylase
MREGKIMKKFDLHHGDCLEVMATMEADSVDAIVTDPPYGLSFMGKNWDHGIPGKPFWEQALRVAKPGAHLLAFGGTRTFHRLVCAIEDAGWEIRDCVMWVYGSGFPKSLDVGKAIDKAAGAEREVVGFGKYANRSRTSGIKTNALGAYSSSESDFETAPATEAAKQWDGWGTALKPAWEPVILARKPLPGTVAENVLRHGVGGLNVDGTRIRTEEDTGRRNVKGPYESSRTWNTSSTGPQDTTGHCKGRYPANLIHDGSEEVLALFPDAFGGSSNGDATVGVSGNSTPLRRGMLIPRNDSGSAARFFYCSKADKRDRDEGCELLEEKVAKRTQDGGDDTRGRPIPRNRNHHPTVKPTSLMQYLCKLITPPDGLVLDPFMGSGSTGKAAMLAGFRFVGIEREAEYLEIARARVAWAEQERTRRFGLMDVLRMEQPAPAPARMESRGSLLSCLG